MGNPYYFTARRLDGETGLYYYRARYYDPYIGRFLQTDPIGYDDGINWYAYVHNNPIMFVDPMGKNVWGGLVSWFAGNGYKPSTCDMGWSEAKEIGVAAAEGGAKGGAAWADGVIPFADPFEAAYANSDGSVDGIYKFSRVMGHVSRDALAAAAIPNIGSWASAPVKYEVGSIAMSNANYARYGLNGLNAVQKGGILVNAFGGGITGAAKATLGLTNLAKGASLINTGLTPGGYLLGIGALEGADYFSKDNTYNHGGKWGK